MKSCLTVCLIILLVFILLIGGLVFAVRPPFRVIAPNRDAADIEVQAAFTEYIMERLELALDDYSGEGDLEVAVDQAGLSQVLSDTLAGQIGKLPTGLKFTGVFMNTRRDYIHIGGGFKFLIFPVGLSARVQVQVEDGNMNLNLLSTHLGRIPLPVNYVLRTAGRFLDLPEEVSTLSVSAPVSFDDADLGIKLTGLELQPEQLLVKLQIEDGLIPEIPDSAMESFEESLPDMHDILADNPPALEALTEIQTLLDESKEEDKQVNPLKLMILGENLYNSLDEEELEQLNAVLDDDVKELLEQVQGSY